MLSNSIKSSENNKEESLLEHLSNEQKNIQYFHWILKIIYGNEGVKLVYQVYIYYTRFKALIHEYIDLR